MNILISGGYGYVGNFIAQYLNEIGHNIIIGSKIHRKNNTLTFRKLELDPDIDQSETFKDIDIFIHAAFDHVKGKYRGGEGNDPERFIKTNLDGSIALFRQAKTAGVRHVIFLSSRAVYGKQEPGTKLSEDMQCNPDTLYGEVKFKAEQELSELSEQHFQTTSLRATGVFGIPARRSDPCFGLNGKQPDFLHQHVAHLLVNPDAPHKWSELFADYLSGKPIAPRAGTEIHGTDLTRAVAVILNHQKAESEIFNLSQIMLDRHDLLKEVGQQTDNKLPLPPRTEIKNYNQMSADKIEDLINHHPERD